jgi:hypothetical protein
MGGVEVFLQSFLKSALDKLVNFMLQPLYARERALVPIE